MATKKSTGQKKTTARRRTTRKTRKTKKSGGGWLKWVLIPLFMGFLALGTVFALLYLPLPTDNDGVDAAMIQSVLIAAEVDGDTSIQKVTKDGIERWKIEVPSRKRKDAIIRSLQNVMVSKGGRFEPGQENRHKGKLVQVVSIGLEDGDQIRLIFVVDGSRKRTQKPRKPKKKPAAKPAVVQKPKAKPDRKPSAKDKPSGADALAALEAEPLEPGDPSRLIDAQEETQAVVNRPMIAIIIDDVGHQPIRQIKPLLDLKYPITFAVLPHLAYSATNSIHLHQNQYEVMLHMPMEPDNFPKANPGEGAILSYLNDGEIRKSVNRALKTVPFALGVNNHMGSKITANRTLMQSVLSEVKKHNLYWIDSRTNSQTVAYDLAKSLGMRTTKRDVFLDAEESYDFVVKQLARTCEVADRKGSAIAIGHPYPSTIKALVDEMPRLNREGYQFVFASKLLEIPGGTF